MQPRSIKELYTKNRRLYKALMWLKNNGHVVKDIREYYTKFVFFVDGRKMEYDKDWKSTAEAFAIDIHNLLIKMKEAGL